jgi:hypothetical protein
VAVNEHVIAALKEAVMEADQPKEVAQRLVSWLEALAKGNAELDSENEAARRISDLLETVRLPHGPEADDSGEPE